MEDQGKPQKTVDTSSAVNVEDRGRTIVLHRVLESELREVGSAQNTLNINLAFFTLAIGLAVGFATILLTSHASLSDRMLTLFTGLCLFSGVASAYFGVMARRDWKDCKSRITSILNASTDRPDH